MKKAYPQIDLRLALKNTISIGSFFRHKDPLPQSLRSGIVYSYECALCNECYIGSTHRQFQCRISEHLGVSARHGQPLANVPYSAIYNHREEKGHVINRDNFKIIDQSTNRQSLRTLESLHIFKSKPKLNTGLPVELSVVC